MTELHEVLAAEKTRNAAWNAVYTETQKKFGNPHFFRGLVRRLRMLEQSPANDALEQQEKQDKPVITSVYATLEYLLQQYAQLEDLQYIKNVTNRNAVGTVMWDGKPFLVDLPVDELLGLEARLNMLRQLFVLLPTLDAGKTWGRSAAAGSHGYVSASEESTKTDKQIQAVVLHPATKEHPAIVDKLSKDVVVGLFTTYHHSGEATALQKAEAIMRIDQLIIEVKQARMRANSIEITEPEQSIGDAIATLLLEALEVT
jgi:hypothetical protein